MNEKFDKDIKTKYLATNGILLALNLNTIILINYIPTNTIALMAVSSLFMAIAIIESNIKFGSIFCVASILLAFILINNKLHFIVYAFTFGNYAIIKYLIESKVRKIKFQYLIKFIYSICAFSALYLVSTAFFDKTILNNSLTIFLPVILIIAYFMYDYLFTMFIEKYNSQFKKMLHRK